MKTLLPLFLLIHFISFGQKEESNSCTEKIKEARILFEEEDFFNANKIIRTIEISKSISCEGEYYLLKGELELVEGSENAIIFLNDALAFFTKKENKKKITISCYWLGMANIENDESEKAASYFDKIIEDKKTLLELELLYDVLDIRAMLYSGKGDRENAMLLLKEALGFATTNKNTEIQVQLLNQISTNYQSEGQIDSAIFYYHNLLEVKKEIKDLSGLLSDYSTLGNLHRELGNYEEAQKAFIEAIRYGEELEDVESLLAIYVNIANLYLDQRLLEPALDYTQKARILAKQNGALLKEGESLQIRATVFEYLNQIDQALLNYQNAFQIFQQLGLKQQMADTQLKIAKLFDTTDNLEKAEVYLKDVLQIRIETADRMGELEAKLGLCDILLKLNKEFENITTWLQDCENIANRIHNTKDLQETYRLQSLLEEQKGNYEFALQRFRAHNEIRDSLINHDNAKTVRELEKLYETEKKDREISEKQDKIKFQEEALRKSNTQVIQLLVGLLVLLILVFLTVITYQRNKQFNKNQLSVLEKERETHSLRAMVSGGEQERRRIARDLHDGLGAIMATVKMRVSVLSKQVPEIEDNESFKKAEELIDDACNNIREISHNMMPGSLSKYGLEVGLEDMCQAMQQSNNIEISFIPYNLDKIMDDIVEINIYRIVQELLKNILKHAEASEAIVQLTLEEENLNITVEDNGKGFDIENTKVNEGIGIGSIRSRVLYLNGNMEIDSKKGNGTSFIIDIPIVTNKKQELWSKS